MAYYFKLPPITDLTIGQQAALNEPNAIAISGGPGTGKSVVSLWRHIRNYGTDSKRSLLLTYTKTLETYLAASARSEAQNAGNEYEKQRIINAANNVDRTYDWTSKRKKEYNEIIIDEAQDVESEKYSIIKNYSQMISYGADDKQIVYQKKSTTEAELEKLFPNNSSHELDENFRNSYQIMHFVKAFLPEKKISTETLNKLYINNKSGNKPIVLVTNNDATKQNKAILDIINQFLSETHNIAILVPLRKHVNYFYQVLVNESIKCSKYESDDDEITVIENIHVTTFKSSKGTEFDTVIIPNFQSYEWNIKNLTDAPITENDYYVGITRAKRNLYLISTSIPYFLERSEQQKLTYSKEIL